MVDLARELEQLRPDEAPAGRAAPSDLRLNIRDNFDAITAARIRGVSWAAIAAAMARAGVRAPGGAEVGWRALKSLFHAERYARERKAGERSGEAKRRNGVRKRRGKGAPAPPPRPEAQPQHPEPGAEPPAPPPSSPGNPYAEAERRLAEARRGREAAERAKDWNPYAIPKETPHDE